MSTLRDADQVVRQCAGAGRGVAGSEVPVVRAADFADVPAGGTGDGPVVRGVLPGIWADADDGEVAVFHVFRHRAGEYGFAGAASSGLGGMAGFSGWSVLCHLRIPARRGRAR